MMEAGSGDAASQDFKTQLFAKRTDLDHEPAGKARADAIVEEIAAAATE